jgi:RNA polymerase sigma factor (sigma-70 family)
MNGTNKERFLPTRKSLLERLQTWDDQEGWKQFYDTYWQLIYGVGRRAGLGHGEAEDLVQDTVVAVVKKMPGFEYDPARCSFKSWLMMVTRSRLSNLFRKLNRRPPRAENVLVDSPTATLAAIPENDSVSIDSIWEEEWQKNLMEQAIRRVKAQVPMEQYQVFDLFVIKEMEGRTVAKTLGISLSRVYVTKHRISKMIRDAVKQLETESTG